MVAALAHPDLDLRDGNTMHQWFSWENSFHTWRESIRGFLQVAKRFLTYNFINCLKCIVPYGERAFAYRQNFEKIDGFFTVFLCCSVGHSMLDFFIDFSPPN